MRLLYWCLFFVAVYAKHESYEGYKSFYVKPVTTEQLKGFHGIADKYNVDVLSHPTLQREGVVLVKPRFVESFLRDLTKDGYKFRVHRDDVKKALEIDDEVIEKRHRDIKARNGGRNLPYSDYLRLEVYDEYMRELAETYPERVTLVTAGNSFQGRPVNYLKISTTNFQDTSKPVIFIDGGIHSREWISPPTVAWAMHKLVEDITETDLAEDIDWILLPIVNPDGYEYTFTNERFWRKTRSTDGSILGSVCPGVDGNRNYGVFWNSAGTSPLLCSDVYAGPRAFSEVETGYVRDIMHEYLDRMPMYLTMHSYGSMILYPWGHDGSLSANWRELQRVGSAMGDAIDNAANEIFPEYLVGNSVIIIGYPAAGAAEDYAHFIGVPLAYTYELPGLTDGFEGFHLDPIWIEQVCNETWEGIVSGARLAVESWKRPRNV